MAIMEYHGQSMGGATDERNIGLRGGGWTRVTPQRVEIIMKLNYKTCRKIQSKEYIHEPTNDNKNQERKTNRKFWKIRIDY